MLLRVTSVLLLHRARPAFRRTRRSRARLAPTGPAVFDYDALGQMKRQRDEQGQRYFTCDVSGKTTGVYLDAAHIQPVVVYAYDDRGFRVRQTVYPILPCPVHVTTYVRDVAGNLLALYEQESATAPAVRSEVPLYGSGRLGTFMSLANGTTDYHYELTDYLGNARVVFHRPTTEVTVETGGCTSQVGFPQQRPLSGTRQWRPQRRLRCPPHRLAAPGAGA